MGLVLHVQYVFQYSSYSGDQWSLVGLHSHELIAYIPGSAAEKQEHGPCQLKQSYVVQFPTITNEVCLSAVFYQWELQDFSKCKYRSMDTTLAAGLYVNVAAILGRSRGKGPSQQQKLIIGYNHCI